MKNFIEILNELSISSNTNINVIRSNDIEYIVKIVVGYDHFVFEARYTDNIMQENTWVISFEDQNGNVDMNKKDSGVSLKLFAAINKIFVDFLNKYNPDNFNFSAKDNEKSRVKLYGTLSKSIIKKLGYKVSISKMGRYIMFDFSKR